MQNIIDSKRNLSVKALLHKGKNPQDLEMQKIQEIIDTQSQFNESQHLLDYSSDIKFGYKK